MLNFIVKRERNGREVIWISQLKLIEIFDTLSEQYLRFSRFSYNKTVSPNRRQQEMMPDTDSSWRWARWNGVYYYDYDRIPDDPRTQYRSKLGTKAELLAKMENDLDQERLRDVRNELLYVMHEVVDDYLVAYSVYDERQRKALCKAAAMVDSATRWIQHNHYNTKKSVFWVDLAAVVNDEAIAYLPKHWRRIKEKVMEVLDGKAIAEVVSLPREGLENRSKKHAAENAEIIAWTVKMRSVDANYTNIFIIRKIRLMCYLTGKHVPSEGWFNNLLKKPEIKAVTINRFGTKGRRRVNQLGYVPIATAMFAGDCWQMDATRFNLIGHRTKDGKEAFLFIIVVRDVHSGDILGEHYDTKEDRYGYMAALKMAVNTSGYVPYELVTDKFPGHNTHEWEAVVARLTALGTKVTQTSLAQGKARLERWFGTLQSVFQMESKYYYGEGIMSKRVYAHRSLEYLKRVRKEAHDQGWNFDDAEKEARKIVQAFRTTAYSSYSKKYEVITDSPCEMHEKSDKPHVVEVQAWEILSLFEAGRVLTLRSNMLKMTVLKCDYIYWVDETIALQYAKMMVYYDIEDMNTVYCWNEAGTEFLCEGTRQKEVQIHGPDAAFDELGKAKERKALMEKARKERATEIQAADVSDVQLLMMQVADKAGQEDLESNYLKRLMSAIPPTPQRGNTQSEGFHELEEEMEGSVVIDYRALTREKY